MSSQMEEILTDCPESIVTVKVSIDGVREKHDRLRGKAGSFEKAMKITAMHKRAMEGLSALPDE